MKQTYAKTYIVSIVTLFSLCFLVLFTGPISVSILEFLASKLSPLNEKILFSIRLPRLLIALFAGGGLATCGLVLQTWFKNKLADPFLLGVHSGSSLGVAFYLLIIQDVFTRFSSFGDFGAIFFGVCGALLVLVLMIIVSAKFKGPIYIIVFGVVISFFITGLINLILSFSSSNELRQFFLWSLGSFDRVTLHESIFVGVSILLMVIALLFNSRALNVCLLGENYAFESGVDLNHLRKFIIPIVGLISGLVSVYCGPVIFIGLMAPHMARMIYSTSDHRILIPGVFICGAILSLIVTLFSNGYFVSASLPINALLGLIGTPFVLMLLIRTNRKGFGG